MAVCTRELGDLGKELKSPDGKHGREQALPVLGKPSNLWGVSLYHDPQTLPIKPEPLKVCAWPEL